MQIKTLTVLQRLRCRWKEVDIVVYVMMWARGHEVIVIRRGDHCQVILGLPFAIHVHVHRVQVHVVLVEKVLCIYIHLYISICIVTFEKCVVLCKYRFYMYKSIPQQHAHLHIGTCIHKVSFMYIFLTLQYWMIMRRIVLHMNSVYCVE